MKRSQSLERLGGLQALLEQRSKADHAKAVRAKQDAQRQEQKAKAKLETLNLALDNYSAQEELQIERFQILAQQINDSAEELEKRCDSFKDASNSEASARQLRVRAERQSDHLSSLHRDALNKERRQEEDRKSRDFLSQRAASNGARV